MEHKDSIALSGYLIIKKQNKAVIEMKMNDIKGCRVIVKDLERDEVVADTKIKEYDAHRKVLKISAGSRNNCRETSISAIVFGKNEEICEYYGRIRKAIIANEIEIEVGKEKNRKNRKEIRYALQEKGNIESVEIEKQMIVLRKPIPVETKNISTDGVLIETMSGSLEVGEHFLLYLKLGEVNFRQEYKVIRIHDTDLNTEQYGCMMIKPQK